MSRRSEEQVLARSRGRPETLPKRWSAQRKAEVVLRLLRGKHIGEVSREVRGRTAGAGAAAAGVPGRGPAGPSSGWNGGVLRQARRGPLTRHVPDLHVL